MIDVTRALARAASKRAQSVAEAVTSLEETLKSDRAYAAADVKAYLLERAQGKTPARPTVKSWRAP